MSFNSTYSNNVLTRMTAMTLLTGVVLRDRDLGVRIVPSWHMVKGK